MKTTPSQPEPAPCQQPQRHITDRQIPKHPCILEVSAQVHQEASLSGGQGNNRNFPFSETRENLQRKTSNVTSLKQSQKVWRLYRQQRRLSSTGKLESYSRLSSKTDDNLDLDTCSLSSISRCETLLSSDVTSLIEDSINQLKLNDTLISQSATSEESGSDQSNTQSTSSPGHSSSDQSKTEATHQPLRLSEMLPSNKLPQQRIAYEDMLYDRFADLERKFTTTMNHGIEMYLYPMQKVLSQSEYECIFQNIDELTTLSQFYLTQMRSFKASHIHSDILAMYYNLPF